VVAFTDHEHVALVQVVVAQHRPRALAEGSGALGDDAFHLGGDLGAASALPELAQLLVELVAHVASLVDSGSRTSVTR
jgi:hypothetical protein